jgi:hypothetical protein
MRCVRPSQPGRRPLRDLQNSRAGVIRLEGGHQTAGFRSSRATVQSVNYKHNIFWLSDRSGAIDAIPDIIFSS